MHSSTCFCTLSFSDFFPIRNTSCLKQKIILHSAIIPELRTSIPSSHLGMKEKSLHGHRLTGSWLKKPKAHYNISENVPPLNHWTAVMMCYVLAGCNSDTLFSQSSCFLHWNVMSYTLKWMFMYDLWDGCIKIIEKMLQFQIGTTETTVTKFGVFFPIITFLTTVNNLRQSHYWTKKGTKQWCQSLSEEILDEISIKEWQFSLKIPQMPCLEHLVQEMLAWTATQLLRLKPF